MYATISLYWNFYDGLYSLAWNLERGPISNEEEDEKQYILGFGAIKWLGAPGLSLLSPPLIRLVAVSHNDN